MRTTCFTVAVCFLLVSYCEAQVYTTPEDAKADPDFALQGEYADSTRGLQVVALGEGEFQVVTYTDGLPGAGWNGKGKQTIDVDVDTLESMLRNFDRVDRKSPTLGAKPPSDAVVLFDGTKAALEKHWKRGAKITDDGLLQQGCTSIDTFSDYTLHLEFRTPFKPAARGQGRGNSGLYHQGRYETQILDSFGLEGKMNETGGLYSIKAPDLNMCLPPLTWQTYDVDFTAARYDSAGKKTANATITVRLNGVVVHRDVELPKSTTASPLKEGPQAGPIFLQDHGNPVRFRNIWVRPRDLSSELLRPIVPGFERFHTSGGDQAEGGRVLLGELNCVACHKASSKFASAITPKQAPILTDVGKRLHPEWMAKFIANPHAVKAGTTMPDLMSGMSDQQRSEAAVAITHYLVGKDSIQSGGKGANTGKGKTLFHESGCLACHMPLDGRSANKATSVPLVDLGDKYSRTSLAAFLSDPLAVRPAGRMPKIGMSDDDRRHIAQYLTGDTSVAFGNKRNLPKEPNMRFTSYSTMVDRFPDLDELEPEQTGVSRGLDIFASGRDEAFLISFRGFLPIKTAGKYSFRLGSDDGGRLYIDDELLIDNDGVHGTQYKEASARLSVGMHSIRVDYFEKGGGEHLSVVWAGPGIESGGIDSAIVMNRDGSDVPKDVATANVVLDEFVFDESKVARGRELFSTLGCASCHVREKGKSLTPLDAPGLENLAIDNSANRGCLGQPKPGVPNYDLTSIQSEAIVAAVSAPEVAQTAKSKLAHTMKSLNCYACHDRGGVGGSESDRNKFFISTIPEMGDEGRLPPPLSGVGDKLREDWIKKVISDGDKSRPYMKTYMPGFGDQSGGRLAKIFAELDQRSEAKITKLDEPAARQVAVGRKMVGSKGLACVSCHTFGKFKSSGIQAIALDTMASRIREDWFHRYLPDPQKYRPGTRMPTGYPEGKSTVKDVYEGHQGKQLSAMWAFLAKGSGGGVPEGIVGGKMELKPDRKPIIYRNFIENVSPRGIAVGYPEKANLCWDAENLSLALIWQDRFIDASKHWTGRGQGTQVPLGGGVVQLESVSPFAKLLTLKAPWPTDSPRQRGYRFLGYRLDEQGRPTFRYRLPNALIEDKPIPVPGDLISSFSRQITVTPDENSDLTGLHFRAAQGNIVAKRNSTFRVDDTLTIRLNTKFVLRSVDGTSELLVPITGPMTIIQEIAW